MGSHEGHKRRWLAWTAVLSAATVANVGLAAGAVDGRSFTSGKAVRVVDEVAVTAMHQGVEFANNSPSIVVDPTEARFVVIANRLDAPDFGCALQVSGDSGRTWVTADPVPKLPEGAEKCYAPEVAFDARGTLYYLFVGLAGPGNRPMGAFLVTSADRGHSFTAPRQMLGPLNFAVRMAIDPHLGDAGRIHLVWIKATSDPSLGGFGPPPNPILAAHSDDGGRTFSEPVQVSGRARERVVAPALTLGPDHAVHVAYYDLGRDAVDYQGLEGAVWEEPWSLVLNSSFDRGGMFADDRVVDDGIMPPERVMLIFTMPPPTLAAGADGLVCAGWTDARHGDADALARCSRDRGRIWDSAQRLNDDPMGNGARQYLPRLSLSPEGRLDAVFFDRRDDPRNVLNHVYLTHSTDDGRSFAPNHRISSEASDTRIGQEYANASAKGQYEIGSRLGLLSLRDRAVAAWPDTRHSVPPTTSQDLFSATVILPAPRSRSLLDRLGNPAFALAGLGALAVVAVGWRRRRTAVAP